MDGRKEGNRVKGILRHGHTTRRGAVTPISVTGRVALEGHTYSLTVFPFGKSDSDRSPCWEDGLEIGRDRGSPCCQVHAPVAKAPETVALSEDLVQRVVRDIRPEEVETLGPVGEHVGSSGRRSSGDGRRVQGRLLPAQAVPCPTRPVEGVLRDRRVTGRPTEG